MNGWPRPHVQVGIYSRAMLLNLRSLAIQCWPPNPTTTPQQVNGTKRRIYSAWTAHELTEEQIAVAFAMTSRRPEPFDEIARQVSEEKAADFHERWVLGYGHASVAEHAVVHLAVEKRFPLGLPDALEDNRLASYTEKSSRYQVMPGDYFHVPEELDDRPALKQEFVEACETLFAAYTRLIDDCLVYLKGVYSQRQGERDGVYKLAVAGVIATDHCRAVLPAATLTNVGVTANARTLEHARIQALVRQADGGKTKLGAGGA